jgi:hypothetical protein
VRKIIDYYDAIERKHGIDPDGPDEVS